MPPQDQNNQSNVTEPVAPSAQPPLPSQVSVDGSMPESPKPKGTKKWLVVLLILLLVGAGAAAAYYFLKPQNDNPKTATTQVTQTDGSVLCVSVGLRSIQCENLTSNELKKYDLPASLEQVSQMVPSKDGQYFYISSWKDKVDHEYLAVYSNDLSLKYALPVKPDKDGALDINQVKWLDNKHVMYERTSGETKVKRMLYSFDVTTGKEQQLMTTEATIEDYMPVGDGKYVFGIEAYDDKPNNATLRKLVLINLSDKTVKDVNNSALNVETDQPAYSQQTGLFYANVIKDEGQKGAGVKTYKVESLGSDTKVTESQLIDNVYYYVPYAGQVITTQKGVIAGEDFLQVRAPIKLYTATDKFTVSKLAVGSQSSLTFSLPSMPDFPLASSQKLVTSDFFKPPKNAPAKIVSYLNKMVTDDQRCKDGEYLTFDLDAWDGDQQFGVLENGCGAAQFSVYKASNGTYKLVMSTQEGVSCESRDKAGISPKVLDCIKPGEGL